MTSEFDTTAARALLARLPEFEPDPRLWSRIVAARRRRQRVRLGWVATGLAATLAAVTVMPRLGAERGADDLASWQQRSQALEREWRARGADTGDARARAQLRLIDGELQAAYDRAAAASELAPLWRQRSEALHDLLDRDGPRMRAVTRL